MKTTNKILVAVLVSFSALTFPACKAKKAVVKTPVTPVAASAPAEPKKEEAAPAAPKTEEKAAPVEKPNFNLANIQFEFNSAVLKTESLPILDAAISEMKKAPDTRFILNGHSSAEGSASHNLSLSVDRANAVKSYLVNSGLNGSNFKIVGHGDKEPISSNATEAGRMLNRRTEIQVEK